MNRGIWGFYIALCVFALTDANAVAANLYRWVDEDGKVQYSQTRPVETPATEKTISIPGTGNSANVSEPLNVISPPALSGS